MAAPIAAGMIFQTLYHLVDLYFVARLGDAAIAGVSAAVLGVGTVALISHAAGRKDQPEANLIFNQSLVLSGLCALITIVAGALVTVPYMSVVAADEATVQAGKTFLYWFMPGLALQFALVAMGSALRGTGIVKPTMVVQVVTVILNIILAPILIAGWGTGLPMGVAGAGLASTLSVTVGVILLGLYFARLEKYVAFHKELWRPRLQAWKRMLAIGLPAGGEFVLMFVYMAVIYWTIRHFGAAAQAGFGVGSRVMQAIFLPAMAVAFAAGPLAGQNYGARRPDRVRETFSKAAWISSFVMIVLTLLAQWRPDWLIAPFSTDPEVHRTALQFLQIMSWNFVAQGIIFTCSSMFQGLGNTRPALLSTGSRLLTFVLPAIWLSGQSWFRIEHMWYLSVATTGLQAFFSLWLLRLEFRQRLGPMPVAAAA
jgi:putative MATE family efflux protein